MKQQISYLKRRVPQVGRRLSARTPNRKRTLILIAIVICSLIASIVSYSLLDNRSTQPQKNPGLTWPAPQLENAQVIALTEKKTTLKLKKDKDYILVLPCGDYVTKNGLTIVGGRNVVMIGGTIRVQNLKLERGLYLNNQTGTVHIEGIHIAGDLNEGINISQKNGAIVQLQDIVIDTVKGSAKGHHADVIQTWAGPAELRVDRLVGSTNYQGFFLLPNQHFKGNPPVLFDLRNIEITSVSDNGYLLWRDKADWPIKTENVKLKTADQSRSNDFLIWPKPSVNPQAWAGVQVINSDVSSKSIQATVKTPAQCPPDSSNTQ